MLSTLVYFRKCINVKICDITYLAIPSQFVDVLPTNMFWFQVQNWCFLLEAGHHYTNVFPHFKFHAEKNSEIALGTFSISLKKLWIVINWQTVRCQVLARTVFVVWCQTASLNANEQSMACILFLMDYAYTFCGQQKGNSRPIWFPFWHATLFSAYKAVSTQID